jgi:hypothetical protein
MNADHLPDETPVRSLCRRLVCTKCGMIGGNVRIEEFGFNMDDVVATFIEPALAQAG